MAFQERITDNYKNSIRQSETVRCLKKVIQAHMKSKYRTNFTQEEHRFPNIEGS